MDDLNGLSWSSNSNPPTNKPPPMSSGLMIPNLRQSNASGRSTPLSTASNRSNSPAKPAAPTGDSFASLVSFGPSAGNKNLSLAEQQKRLEAEKAQKEIENRKRFESQYGGQNSQFWDNFEQGRTRSPAGGALSQPVASTADDDDLLAAFNAKAPVDASTNFPIPSASPSPGLGARPSQGVNGGGIQMQDNTGGMSAFDDDDPFGLSDLKSKSAARSAPAPAQEDDDDFLGLLGKPVSEIPRQQVVPETRASPVNGREESEASPMPSNDVDRAIAELVDMGFPADKARLALRTTSSGTDVQAAVSWLLTSAHAEARQKAQGRSPANDHPERSQSRNRDAPSWQNERRFQDPRSRDDSRSPAAGEKDPAQIAAQFGNNFLKTANSLWKTGSKKFQQAVNEFNADHDPSQPKWMRDASVSREESPSQPPLPTRRADGTGQPQGQKDTEFTNEALLLDSQETRPRKPPRPSQPASSGRDLRPQPSPPAGQLMQQQPHFLQRPSRPSSQEPKSRLSRFAAEEQSAQAYVSPARRKRPQAQAQAPPAAPEPTVDLFDSPAPSTNQSKPTPSRPTPPPARSASIPVRPKAPPRSIPPVSPEALQSTHRHREKAAEAYKRGDYAAAHASFSTALGMLPDRHPITIMIRSNRAMTALKTGEPKTAIDDADIILDLIGPSRGENEVIELENGEPAKSMRDFFGKALMRKAEALEQLERWADAAQAWKLAVETGHGGSTCIQGRNRCEKAAGISKSPTKPSAPAKRRPAPVPKKVSALSDLGPSSSGQDSAAVARLREANQAAERADQEKFALTDSVDSRIAKWKNGKQDNLRALLGSLDTVLWSEAGWKKVGLSDLVLANKVKINYMKGIAKVHPDKIPTTATTEQRMIAGAVFGALNEAWDKFRVDEKL